MGKYDHIDAPYEFKDYWSKYPHGYSIYEALLNWVQQVNDLLDSNATLEQNLATLQANMDAFLSTVPDQLQALAEAQLNAWLTDGTLEALINTVLFDGLNNDLQQRAINIENFPRLTGETSDTPRIIRALATIETPEYTEAIPAQGAYGSLFFPAGRYTITAKIPVRSYIRIHGAGRHATIFDSFITNGDPVFEVKASIDAQQFYVTLESFTINGRYQDCQGIAIIRTSRWILRDVMIDSTLREGLYLYRCFLGEIYSPLVRACGSIGYYAVVMTGTSSVSGGAHAITWIGGEINGGTGTQHAVLMEFGNNTGFVGTTIEGFRDGRGITVVNANAFYVHGCYFELNKEDIVEIGATLGNSYRDNIHALLADGARGIIGITNAQGLTISGGYMQGNASIVKVFDATLDSSGKLHMSTIEPLYCTAFPITISASLLASAKNTGTRITTYNANNQLRVYGDHQFNDLIDFTAEISPRAGLNNIGGFTRSKLTASDGSPEGVIVADIGSICLNGNDTANRSTAVYLKANGVNNNTGWLPFQGIQASTTAGRPTVTTVGYMVFDSTLGKPIWWNGSVWKDATGTTV